MTPWDCPNCGTVNPGESRLCDCGYDIVERRSLGRAQPPASLGVYQTYQLIRFGLGGLACGFLGIGLVIWELSERSPSIWAIIRSLLISAFGFGMLGVLVWISFRRRS